MIRSLFGLAVTTAHLLAITTTVTASYSSSSSKNYGSSSSSSGYASSSSSSVDAYGVNFFAESTNSLYDGYQQAWRYLGWYVDCGNPSGRYNERASHASHDNNNNKKTYGNMYCQRYLMWAAYIDPNYSGGGIGEYSFYDADSGSWDESACQAHGNGRCVPMDCHELDTTTWKLLGVFKEAVYFGNNAFFEQLFKHEGVCVWNDEDLYDFMSEARQGSWSEGCLQTHTLNDDASDYLYIDLKPTYNGNMTYSLYTDYICKTQYDGMSVSVDTVAKSMGLLYGDYLVTWNDALEIYKVCQPCRAYNLQYSISTSSYKNRYSKYDNGKYQYYSSQTKTTSSWGSTSAYNKYSSSSYYNRNGGNNRQLANNNNNNNDDAYSDPNEGYFQCYDDADYTNVNQCMKFRTHAELKVATWEDLVSATNQGGILPINVTGTIFGSDRITREQEQYVDNIRRQEVAQAKAEKKAAKEALALSDEKRSDAFRFMVTGAIALACAVLFTIKNIAVAMVGGGSRSNPVLQEPLYNPDAVAA